MILQLLWKDWLQNVLKGRYFVLNCNAVSNNRRVPDISVFFHTWWLD